MLVSCVIVLFSGDGWLEGAANVLTPEDTIVVFNKTDLLATDLPRVSPVLGGREGASSSSSSVCWLSCRTEEGMDGFMQTLKRHLEGLYVYYTVWYVV